MTTISVVAARTYTPDMFADLTDVPHVRTFVKPVTTLTFAEDLPAGVAEAIWARLESKDDVDQAKRAALRADRDALAEGDPLRRLYDYLLGD